MFLKRDATGDIQLGTAKLVDEILVTGTESNIALFMQHLPDKLEVGKVQVGNLITFGGCDVIEDSDSNLILSKVPYISQLQLIEISRARKRNREEWATESETHAYRTLAGTLM